MNNIYSVPTVAGDDNLRKAILTDVQQKISEAAFSAEKESKEKYEAKAKLIEAATDMSTQEKLDAMDKNYERRNQENWQNVLTFATVSIGVIGLVVGSPAAVKTVRKLIAA